MNWPAFSIANRDTAAPLGSVIENVPSRVRASGLWKYRWSSVNASGPSTTALASTRVNSRPLPSDAVSDHGGASSRDGGWLDATNIVVTGVTLPGASAITGDGDRVRGDGVPVSACEPLQAMEIARTASTLGRRRMV